MVEVGLKKKIKQTKAFEWHYDYLTTKNDSKAILYANIATAMFFGHIMQPVMLAVLFFLTYAVSFVVWSRKNKAKELETPDWIEENNNNDYQDKVNFYPTPEQAREMIRRGETVNDYIDDSEDDKCEVDGCERDAEYEVAYEEVHEPIVMRDVCFIHQRLDEALRYKYGRFHSVFSEWARQKLREEIEDE